MLRALALTTTRNTVSANHLIVFPLGAHLLLQHHAKQRWDTPAVVVEVSDNREYMIKTASGQLFAVK
jgi:hypothetical protein